MKTSFDSTTPIVRNNIGFLVLLVSILHVSLGVFIGTGIQIKLDESIYQPNLYTSICLIGYYLIGLFVTYRIILFTRIRNAE